jgi:hypothetical protein
MDKWIKILMLLTAAVFFFVGAISLPFGVWTSNDQGTQPLLGWLIYIASVGIPWAIAIALARYALKRNQD